MSIGLPGDEWVLAGDLQSRLREAGREGADLATLRAALPDREPEEIDRALAELVRDGRAVERGGRWHDLAATDLRVGVLQVLSRGDALLRSGAGGEPGFLVPRSHLGAGRDGDLVLARPLRGRRGRGRDRDLPRAAVTRVLDRRLSRLVGRVIGERGSAERRLVPFDPKLDVEVRLRDGTAARPGDFVVAELDPQGAVGARGLSGRVVETLGNPGEPGTDVRVVLRHLEIPEEFPPAVLAAAEALPEDPGPEDFAGRTDLRELMTVTIDGGQARDFDDAVSVERLGGGRFRLGVHIADVSHYVEEGSVLDLEAYKRGTSVYFPERAVPMLPERLSNGLCSLRPGVPRLVLSAFLEITREGAVVGRSFTRSVLQSHRRLTYLEVRRLLEEPEPGDEAEYGKVLVLLRDAAELMARLHGVRLGRGSIDFDLPHGDVILDTDGYAVDVQPGQRSVAHRIIEEFMIAANEAVALELDGRDEPALYRVHERPSDDRLAELREILQSLGHDLPGDLGQLHPTALQRVLERVEGRPEEPFVASLVLRAMQRAAYEPSCDGHYALATRHYTHFTSPIRRYPDLLVHRQLSAAVLGGDSRRAERTLLRERLPGIAERCSRTERRAERAERIILQWKLVRLLAGRTGERFAGRITGVQPFGLFVQLVDYFVDGLVPIRTLADDYYELDAAAHRLVGRERGRVFRLGDEVEVVLTGVDERRRGLALEVAGMPEPLRERRARGQRGSSGRPPGVGRIR